MDKQLKPCPFCGHKNARVVERRNTRRSWYDAKNRQWYEIDKDFQMTCEAVIKVSANVMCNACRAKGGTAVGFIEDWLHKPREEMKKRYNCERLTAIHDRAIEKWNRRESNG